MSNDTTDRKPLVSIVIPVHDAYYRYLPECLRSVKAQKFPSWEACVVDDRPCGDAGAQIVAAAADPRIQYIRHDVNRGLAAARNTGIRATSAPLVVTVDADDQIAGTFIGALHDSLTSNPNRNAAFSDLHLFGNRSRTLHLKVKDARALVKENWIPGPGTMFQRSLWERVGGYCEHPVLRAGCEDWDFWLTATKHGLSTVHVAQALYHYRQHGSSMLQSLQYVDHEVRRLLYERHHELIDEFGLRRYFFGEGYRRAARAAILRREWRRGITLAAWSAALAPGHFMSEAMLTVGRAMSKAVGSQEAEPQLSSSAT